MKEIAWKEASARTPARVVATTPSDEQLMEMICGGNSEGLRCLHERYALVFKSIVRRIVQDESEAEDVAQEALIEIWNRAGSYDPAKGRPLSWISTLIRRRSIDRLRRRLAYQRLGDRLTVELRTHESGWKTHVEEDFARKEMQQQLKRVLATLPEMQRQAVELTYYQGLSQREIAQRTGIPLGTIKTRLELGMKKAANALSGWRDLISGETPYINSRSSAAISSRD
jgi:RNA polymerase sigma-70 factor, ECF subfamily